MASQQTTRTGSRSTRRRRLLGLGAVATAALVTLAGCTTGAPKHQPGSPVGNQGKPTVTAITSPSQVAAPPATIGSPQSGKTIDPVTPVTVTASGGTLLDVVMRNSAGKAVSGAVADDGSDWHNTEDLGYAKTYSITATAVNANGQRTTKRLSVSTLTPGNMTMPYLNDEYGTSIVNGATYGVGMIAVVHFDEPIPNHAAAERQLQVTTTPSQPGAWYWLDDQNVHYRPQTFYQPGTKVTITAKVYGHDLGDGLYGQADQSVSFTIGEKHVSIADAKTHQVKVYFSDKLVRTMPTSMGQGGWVDGRNGKISLWTMPGTYTVLGHENPAIMSSDSYGLPADSPYGYAPEKVPWATKISTDGIYLHELDATVWAQGHQNLSHGCLNLNYTNAKWYYNTSRVGDVVIVRNSGGPAIKVWQGGDWSVPWDQWLAGSALH